MRCRPSLTQRGSKSTRAKPNPFGVGLEKGKPQYYRIQGPAFLIEYDNTQDQVNHIHTTWRNFAGDFGRDLLAEHYRRDHPAAR